MAQSFVTKVKSISPIEGKDLIVKLVTEASTDEFIVKKEDNYQVGDKVVVIMNDSLIPENKRTKGLACYTYLKEKYFSTKFNMIRTTVVKMASVKSRGLIEKISVVKLPWLRTLNRDLDSYFNIQDAKADADEGQINLKTKCIGLLFKFFPNLAIKLFGKKLSKAQRVLHPFTKLINKSDEENAQKMADVIQQRANETVWATVKYEGKSSTFCIEDGIFKVSSRNLSYDDTPENRADKQCDDYFKVADKYRIKEILEKLEGNYVIQGEIVGPGIQSNIYGLKDLHLKIFRVKDLKSGKLLNFDELYEFVAKVNAMGYELETVEVLKKYDKLSDFITVNNINEVCEGLYKISNFEVFPGDVIKFHYNDGTVTNPKKGIYPNEGIVLHFMDGFSFKAKPEVDYKLWYNSGIKAKVN